MRSYGQYADWMGAFLIAEILGEKFDGAEALAGLAEIEARATGTARQLVPHAYECFATATRHSSARVAALEALRRLATDADETVRQEAQTSLAKLISVETDATAKK